MQSMQTAVRLVFDRSYRESGRQKNTIDPIRSIFVSHLGRTRLANSCIEAGLNRHRTLYPSDGDRCIRDTHLDFRLKPAHLP